MLYILLPSVQFTLMFSYIMAVESAELHDTIFNLSKIVSY